MGAWCSGTCCTWARSITRSSWRGASRSKFLTKPVTQPRTLSLFPRIAAKRALPDASIVRLRLSQVRPSTQCMRFPAATGIKMCNIVFAVAVQSTKIDRRLCLIELGSVAECSIVLLVQSTSCGHLLEFFACWDALQHLRIVNLTAGSCAGFCDPETKRSAGQQNQKLASALRMRVTANIETSTTPTICAVRLSLISADIIRLTPRPGGSEDHIFPLSPPPPPLL